MAFVQRSHIDNSSRQFNKQSNNKGKNVKSTQFIKTILVSTLMLGATEAAFAANWGSYNNLTVEAKLIGGQQYEGLYARIAKWEEETGAKVKIISKKSHFEIDKEIKSDMAAGTRNYAWALTIHLFHLNTRG
jgi:ABC-type glycerol-3-phosphate transport system substrate-binding protein